MLGVYAAARALDEDGWRLFAHDVVRSTTWISACMVR